MFASNDNTLSLICLPRQSVNTSRDTDERPPLQFHHSDCDEQAAIAHNIFLTYGHVRTKVYLDNP